VVGEFWKTDGAFRVLDHVEQFIAISVESPRKLNSLVQLGPKPSRLVAGEGTSTEPQRTATRQPGTTQHSTSINSPAAQLGRGPNELFRTVFEPFSARGP
jgi:hypothetical protein